jgi:hypothetical protein
MQTKVSELVLSLYLICIQYLVSSVQANSLVTVCPLCKCHSLFAIHSNFFSLTIDYFSSGLSAYFFGPILNLSNTLREGGISPWCLQGQGGGQIFFIKLWHAILKWPLALLGLLFWLYCKHNLPNPLGDLPLSMPWSLSL